MYVHSSVDLRVAFETLLPDVNLSTGLVCHTCNCSFIKGGLKNKIIFQPFRYTDEFTLPPKMFGSFADSK